MKNQLEWMGGQSALAQLKGEENGEYLGPSVLRRFLGLAS